MAPPDLLARIASLLSEQPPPPRFPERSQGAVLLPLTALGGGCAPALSEETAVLFTVRTEGVATHKGQVSFPGGRIEPGETPRSAACRETMEELGIPEDRIRVLGALGGFPTLTSAWEIRCFVGHLAPGSLAPLAGEVAEVFEIPLAELRLKRRLQRRERATAPPVWPTFGHARGERHLTVWGATARILAEFLDRIEAAGLP